MRKVLLVALTAALVPGAAVALPLPAEGPFGDNPWMERRVLNIAHRGGAIEAPENTLFAYHKALEAGADVLEADVYMTSDEEIVVIHDASVDRTTNGTGGIGDLTLAELKELDAAYWYANGRGATSNAAPEEYLYRGVATGDKLPPKISEDPEDERRYSPDDFKIPTLDEFLAAFPDALMVIELKPNPEDTGTFEPAVADILREHERSDDVTIASFIDTHLEVLKAYAPEIHTSFATGQAGVFWASSQGPLPGTPNRHVALQVPTDLGVNVVNQDFVNDAHANDIAVHVWTINGASQMGELLELGVDGIMTDAPSLLEAEIQGRGLAYEPPGN